MGIFVKGIHSFAGSNERSKVGTVGDGGDAVDEGVWLGGGVGEAGRGEGVGSARGIDVAGKEDVSVAG